MAGSIEAYQTRAGVRYRVRYNKPDGTRTDKRGFTTKRDAKLFLANTDVQKSRGEYIDPADSKRHVLDIGETWKAARLANLKPSSRAVMETSWRVHVAPKWGDREVGSIRRSEVASWVGEMTSRRSAQTVRRAAFVLSGVLEVAVDDRAISSNPAAGLDLPKKARKEVRYLTHWQVDRLARAAEYPTLVRFLAYTGLRWGEAAALRVRSVDLEKRRANIRENAVIVNGVYEIGTPKTGASRVVTFPPFLASDLRELTEGRDGDHFVFGASQPMPYPHATSGWFSNAIRAAQEDDPEFPRVTLHGLRHTAASLAISSGANVKAVQRMLGHASAAMTLDVYADLFDTDLVAVSDALGEARENALR